MYIISHYNKPIVMYAGYVERIFPKANLKGYVIEDQNDRHIFWDYLKEHEINMSHVFRGTKKQIKKRVERSMGWHESFGFFISREEEDFLEIVQEDFYDGRINLKLRVSFEEVKIDPCIS